METELTSRERFLRLLLNEPADRALFWPDCFWEETLARWREEGMPPDYDFQFDFTESESKNALGVNMGYYPPFKTEVIKDEGSTRIVRDEYGVVKRVRGHSLRSMQFLEFPVHDRSSWEMIKPRLDPNSSGRFPEDWSQRIEALKRADYPVTFIYGHLCGFFSFLRELFGERVYYLLYDDADLVKEILDFQVYRLTTFVRKITKDVQIDRQFIWEDMCYKNGPLIGPDMFRDFLLEPYQRTIEASKSCGVRIFDVDSDGDVNALIPLWLEAGVNVNHPCEVAAGVDVVRMKKRFGAKLILHGGIDKREIASGFDAIDRELERIRPAYEMGGYFPHVDHFVPPDVSWENYAYYLDKMRRLVGAGAS